MKSIMQNERACYLTGYTGDLHKHHIYGGNGRRRICEAHGFLAEALPLAASTGKPVCGYYLRPDLHNLSDQAVASLALALLAGVHFNHELDLQLKQDCPYSGFAAVGSSRGAAARAYL